MSPDGCRVSWTVCDTPEAPRNNCELDSIVVEPDWSLCARDSVQTTRQCDGDGDDDDSIIFCFFFFCMHETVVGPHGQMCTSIVWTHQVQHIGTRKSHGSNTGWQEPSDGTGKTCWTWNILCSVESNQWRHNTVLLNYHSYKRPLCIPVGHTALYVG